MTLKKAKRTLPKKEPTSLFRNHRNINGKAVKDEEPTSGKCESSQTMQDRPAKEDLKGRETAPQRMALQANIYTQPPPKTTLTSSDNLGMSPRTPGNAASCLPTKSMASIDISPPKWPQMQPQESTYGHRSVTRDAAKTSGKATPGSLQTQTPLPSEPIYIVSSAPSPKLQTPQSTEITPASTQSANPSSSIAHNHISQSYPKSNGGAHSRAKGGARSPGLLWPAQEVACGTPSERLGCEAGDISGKNPYKVGKGALVATAQTNNLENENTWLREEVERLKNQQMREGIEKLILMIENKQLRDRWMREEIQRLMETIEIRQLKEEIERLRRFGGED
ncbi:hypothetical protein V5O48_012308 [Marasmius crinis-equi]|uniref:Uncharacterized protein n=1 Tax=Marasmius crinis-equi TaxID=585013 RepID=A0ABR3F350_9AGAR